MNPSDRPRKTSTPILVKLAHASAPFLSTFLLIHLSAPVLANVGGSNLSSNLMVRLTGKKAPARDANCERTRIAISGTSSSWEGKKYLLLTPFLIHVASSISRRLFAPASKQPRKLTSALSLAGYTSLVFLPIHVFTHRLAPTDASLPIAAVGTCRTGLRVREDRD
ncbi:hypothetical protein J3R83DRAFT_1491 [Lanmaoa asiatica]|nr:hypothetical protein J3R83DRAFT_1491 [Lanmaoa asiatica]